MSTQYNREPPPTASATIHTTVGPIQISLFAKQTPLACKNFIQHCLDGYYTNTTFHRIVPGFIAQAGDPTGTGFGGASIYEDAEFERDPRDPTQKIVLGDEIHSRLRFNRRGLVGMAKGEDGRYGSQFFVTLGPADRELTGSCTLFGRVEGDGIYNVVKIAEAELAEGTERPIYAVKITGCEVDELGPYEGQLKKRERVAVSEKRPDKRETVKKKKKQGKAGKTLLSFGEDEEDSSTVTKPGKPKFNTNLISDVPVQEEKKQHSPPKEKESMPSIPESVEQSSSKPSRKRSRSPSVSRSPQANRRLSRDPNTQLPLPDPETASRSASPTSDRPSKASRLNAEIESLKASMRRTTKPVSDEPTRKLSALEALIPKTSIRGRKRPTLGSSTNGGDLNGRYQDEEDTLKRLQAFKARLEKADSESSKKLPQSSAKPPSTAMAENSASIDTHDDSGEEEEEAQTCDLHFIVNCQSCRAWDSEDISTAAHADDNARDWMTHELKFAKDQLGKDQKWRESHRDVDGLVVIDPREKEKEIKAGGRRQDLQYGREREREKKMEWAKKQGYSR